MSDTVVQYHRVAAANEIVAGQGHRVSIGGCDIAIFHIDGEFFAIDDTCTHGFASLCEGFVDGDRIECPLHAGQFEIKTGKAVEAPCAIDLRTYPVRLDEDGIHVGIPMST